MRHPISDPPHPDRGEWTGWSGLHAQVHRVIATITWSDGSVSEHATFAHQWTRTHVLVSLVGDWWERPRRYGQIWLPAAKVRRNTTPPEVGEAIPAPWRGPTWLVEATQADVDAWNDAVSRRGG